MPQNSKANVSTTRGLVGGYFLSAPLGTTDVPTKNNFTTWTPTSVWENQGYIPEDGFTEGISKDGGDAIRDINLDTVDYAAGSATETLQVGLMEMNGRALATQYGHANVTDSNGTIEVKHNWGASDETRMYVLLLRLKNGRKWVKFIPAGKVTELAELTGNATTVASRVATITYATDENGVGCYDWIESNDTPGPQLTALSGVTLSPTFSADTHAYTATSSSASVTLTATAATGNTVAIKDGNGNTRSSGSAAPLVTGANVFTITVTNNTTQAVGTYTLTITKSS